MAYRLTLRQDEVRWLRERRAQLYVDLLTSARRERAPGFAEQFQLI
jgi:hypothetical protein